jgi:transcriptional regulator with XRE-family HTH domain
MLRAMPRNVYLLENLGPRLRRLRQERGWTLDQLAELAGCSSRAMAYYETTAKCPPAPVVARLAGAFDLSMEVLMGRDEVATRRTQHDPNLLKDAEDRKLWKKFRQIAHLSERDQAYMFKTLAMLIEAKGLEKSA